MLMFCYMTKGKKTLMASFKKWGGQSHPKHPTSFAYDYNYYYDYLIPNSMIRLTPLHNVNFPKTPE